MRFEVKALGNDGSLTVVSLDAVSAVEATRMAESQGYSVLSVASSGVLGGLRGIGGGRQKFPLKLFSQELLSLFESGLTVVEAMEVLAEKEKQASTRDTLNGIIAALREGRTLSTAMEAVPQIFPPLYVATMRASEKTSDLDEALRRYIAYQNQVDELRGKLVSASVYPLLLLGVGGLIIIFLLAFVVPRFSRIYEDLHGDLPWLSQVMLEWGRFAENYGLLAAGGAVAAAYAFYRLMQRQEVRAWIGAWLWRSPSIGERLRTFHLSRCYRTVGMLLRGGIPFTTALRMVADLLAPALRPGLLQATDRIAEGMPASRALEQYGLVTPVSLRLIRVGEQTGAMGEMMERIATFHDEEMARWVDMVSRLFGPVLMLFIGLMIGMIVVLLYLPIFQVAESIQ